MSASGNQPTLLRGLSLLWFPIAFAALLGGLALSAYSEPQPHAVKLAVVAPDQAARSLAGRLDAIYPEGFRTRQYPSREAAADAIRAQDAVAGVVDAQGAPTILVATAAGNVRATYLSRVLPGVLAQEGWRGAPAVVDVAPRNAKDATGNAMMFWALPQLVAGFLTSILLLQFAAWSVRRKLGVIAAIGAATSAVAFWIAAGMDVVPAEPLLIAYGFLLIQAISWIGVGVAPFVKQYFVVVVATFVMGLGIPSAGGIVPPDLLPSVPRWLSAVMPLAQTISLARSAAYFDGHGTARPLSILFGWAALGLALLAAAQWRSRVVRSRSAAAEEVVAAASGAPGTLLDREIIGKIHTFDGKPVHGATVTALNSAGQAWSGSSQPDGTYAITGLPAGALYVVVVAPHSEPTFSTVVIHRRQAHVRHDVVLVDWQEPVVAAAESHFVS